MHALAHRVPFASHATGSCALRPLDRVPSGFPLEGRLFEVVRGGVFGGRTFAEGELLWAGATAEEGDRVVLVARGPGRPRLGCVRGRQLLGDHGEPCHTSRWEVAGKLLGVVRPVGAGWAVERLDAPGLVGMAPSAGGERGAPASAGGTGRPAPAVAPGQLSLFAA